MQKTLILIALGAYAMAVPHDVVKSKLAQIKGNGHDDPVGEGLVCDCELSGTVGAGLGDAAQGLDGSFAVATVVTETEEESSHPDNLFAIECATESCSCDEEIAESQRASSSQRVY